MGKRNIDNNDEGRKRIEEDEMRGKIKRNKMSKRKDRKIGEEIKRSGEEGKEKREREKMKKIEIRGIKRRKERMGKIERELKVEEDKKVKEIERIGMVEGGEKGKKGIVKK